MISTNRRGFTLVELLVVIAMIAVILGAFTTSVSASMQRARIQRATSDVKVMTQAILAYENFSRGGKFELPTMTRADANSGSLGFLLGRGGGSDTGKIPVLLMAQLRSGGDIVDPWGTPYKVTIRGAGASVRIESGTGSLQTGFTLPNLYRLGPEDRQ